MLSANVSANGIELEDNFSSPNIGTRSDLNGRSSAKPLGGDQEDVFPEQESPRTGSRNFPDLNQMQEDDKE